MTTESAPPAPLPVSLTASIRAPNCSTPRMREPEWCVDAGLCAPVNLARDAMAVDPLRALDTDGTLLQGLIAEASKRGLVKILVAEDSGTSRLLLARVLQAAGHEVLAVENGARALEMYVRHQPAVVITDWQMPELDGLQLVKRIRGFRSPRYTWLIMLTSREFRTNYAATMQAGVDDYLTKPLDTELLLVRIAVAQRVVQLSQEVALLKRVIPLCMGCHAVRDTTEQWMELDQYFRRQTGLDFSHGFCPDCFFEKSVLPELERLEASPPSRLDRSTNPELFDDVVTYLGVVGDRLVASVERRGVRFEDGEQLKLVGRLAAALGDRYLVAFAAAGLDTFLPQLLRDLLSRVSAAAGAAPAAPVTLDEGEGELTGALALSRGHWQLQRPPLHLPSSSIDLPATHAAHADSTNTPASAEVDQKQPTRRPS